MAPTSMLPRGKAALRPHAGALRHPLQPGRLGLDSRLSDGRQGCAEPQGGRCPPGVSAVPSPGTQRAPQPCAWALRPGEARGSAGPRWRGGDWVSVSCKRSGDREIEEFPGTAPGAVMFARRQGGGEQAGVQCRGPVALWKFQREQGKTGPGKAPPECTCSQPPPE